MANPADRAQLRANALLQQLSPGDQALIAPHAELIVADCGTSVLDADEALTAAFFPGTALVSVEDCSVPGRRVELAVVGREGLLGWPALLGSNRAGHSATIRMRAGTLLRIPLKPLLSACVQSSSLFRTLLQFVHTMMVQMSRAVISGVQHSIDQRLARWLLMRHDRAGSDLVEVHHKDIAQNLSVRRASITDRLHVLEGERLVKCTRGKLLVRDRPGLERYAGNAYGVEERDYKLLINPDSTKVAADVPVGSFATLRPVDNDWY